MPVIPTARPPLALMMETMSWLTRPPSTISTTSMVCCIGDPHAADELRGDVQSLQQVTDLRPAAVNHDGIQPDQLQQHDVPGEGVLQRLVDHGVAAIFDDQRAAVKLLDVRQGFRQYGCDVGCLVGRDRHRLFL